MCRIHPFFCVARRGRCNERGGEKACMHAYIQTCSHTHLSSIHPDLLAKFDFEFELKKKKQNSLLRGKSDEWYIVVLDRYIACTSSPSHLLNQAWLTDRSIERTQTWPDVTYLGISYLFGKNKTMIMLCCLGSIAHHEDQRCLDLHEWLCRGKDRVGCCLQCCC